MHATDSLTSPFPGSLPLLSFALQPPRIFSPGERERERERERESFYSAVLLLVNGNGVKYLYENNHETEQILVIADIEAN